MQARLLHALDTPYRPPYRGIRAFEVEEPLFVDIGANRGLSISTLRTMKPDARIIGFEPNYTLVDQVRTFFEDDLHVQIVACGLGDSRRELTLYIPVYGSYRFDALASVDREHAQNWLNADRLLGFDPKKVAIEEMRVQIRTLDEFELAPFLIKVYAQGYEGEVVAGAQKTIEKHTPVMLVPRRQEKADRLLREFGYSRFSWIGNEFVPEADVGYVVYYLTPEHVRLLHSSSSFSRTPLV